MFSQVNYLNGSSSVRHSGGIMRCIGKMRDRWLRGLQRWLSRYLIRLERG